MHDSRALENFFDECEQRGLFTRRYSDASKELFDAAKIVFDHLCRLDKNNLRPAESFTLGEFANCYANYDGFGGRATRHFREPGKPETER